MTIETKPTKAPKAAKKKAPIVTNTANTANTAKPVVAVKAVKPAVDAKTMGVQATTVVDVERSYPAPASPPPLLVRILAQHRRHGTASEHAFAKSIEATLREAMARINKLDGLTASYLEHVEGAMSLTVSKVVQGKVVPSPTLFSCHIDTCDDGRIWTASVAGTDSVTPPALPSPKKLIYDPNFGHIALDKDDSAACLGADDGVGVWIMLMMIDNNRPGTYMFHRGEEVGCISAKAVRAKEKAWLEQFEISVAFDRPNNTEIITHQRGRRCASDKFAKALQVALAKHGVDLEPSDRGVYTDNAEYADIIPEVVNLGVGYWGQHNKGETLDVGYAAALLDAVMKVDFDALPVHRDPAVFESKYGQYGAAGYTPSGHGYRPPVYTPPAHHRQMDLALDNRLSKQADEHFSRSKATPFEDALDLVDGANRDDIEALIADSPEEAVTVIMALLLENAALKARNEVLGDLLGAV